MSDELIAYLDGTRVGRFTRTGRGIVYDTDPVWREQARRLEISLSLPKATLHHAGGAPENFLWNLLPDNDGVLARWGARFSVSPRNPMALLAHVGLDTAGAVQLSPDDAPALAGPERREPIDDAAIAAHIRELGVDPAGWLFDGSDHGYFSLAGAQSKFALARNGDGTWSIPEGRAASTHIFKPGIRGLDRSALNEHLTMEAARLLGFDVAATSVQRFEDQSVIVVERFDRTPAADRGGTGGGITRHHQEDFAQAAGIHPASKYQSDGGPGIAGIAKILRAQRGGDEEVQRFFEATMLNWALLGTDAHAKNYSLLHDPRTGPRLAPLYDVASALPYGLPDRKARLAMSYAGHYRVHEIEERHIAAEADAIGIDPERAAARLRLLLDGIGDAYSQAARDAHLTGEDRRFADALTDAAAARAAALRARIVKGHRPEAAGHRPAPPRRSPSSAASRAEPRQPRRKDVGAGGNGGRFARGNDGPGDSDGDGDSPQPA